MLVNGCQQTDGSMAANKGNIFQALPGDVDRASPDRQGLIPDQENVDLIVDTITHEKQPILLGGSINSETANQAPCGMEIKKCDQEMSCANRPLDDLEVVHPKVPRRPH